MLQVSVWSMFLSYSQQPIYLYCRIHLNLFCYIWCNWIHYAAHWWNEMWFYKKQLTSWPITVSQKLECKGTDGYYRCSRCNEYHLCQKCFNTPTHTDHSFEFRAVSTKHSGSMRCGLKESCLLGVKERATPSMTQTVPANEVSHCHA